MSTQTSGRNCAAWLCLLYLCWFGSVVAPTPAPGFKFDAYSKQLGLAFGGFAFLAPSKEVAGQAAQFQSAGFAALSEEYGLEPKQNVIVMNVGSSTLQAFYMKAGTAAPVKVPALATLGAKALTTTPAQMEDVLNCITKIRKEQKLGDAVAILFNAAGYLVNAVVDSAATKPGAGNMLQLGAGAGAGAAKPRIANSFTLASAGTLTATGATAKKKDAAAKSIAAIKTFEALAQTLKIKDVYIKPRQKPNVDTSWARNLLAQPENKEFSAVAELSGNSITLSVRDKPKDIADKVFKVDAEFEKVEKNSDAVSATQLATKVENALKALLKRAGARLDPKKVLVRQTGSRMRGKSPAGASARVIVIENRLREDDDLDDDAPDQDQDQEREGEQEGDGDAGAEEDAFGEALNSIDEKIAFWKSYRTGFVAGSHRKQAARHGYGHAYAHAHAQQERQNTEW